MIRKDNNSSGSIRCGEAIGRARVLGEGGIRGTRKLLVLGADMEEAGDCVRSQGCDRISGICRYVNSDRSQ